MLAYYHQPYFLSLSLLGGDLESVVFVEVFIGDFYTFLAYSGLNVVLKL